MRVLWGDIDGLCPFSAFSLSHTHCCVCVCVCVCVLALEARVRVCIRGCVRNLSKSPLPWSKRTPSPSHHPLLLIPLSFLMHHLSITLISRSLSFSQWPPLPP